MTHLHHQDQLIIGQVIVVDGDPPDVISQARLDDQLPCHIKITHAVLQGHDLQVLKTEPQPQ